jgi:hypothetical protein
VPPTFLYFLALMLWVLMACGVWLIALLMALAPRTRPLVWPTALAMATTFPGVFLFQAVAAPLIVLILLPFFWWNFELTTTNPFVIAIGGAALLLVLAITAAMSLLGFTEGWRTGWRIARRQSLRDAIRSGPTAKLFAMALERWRRLI